MELLTLVMQDSGQFFCMQLTQLREPMASLLDSEAQFVQRTIDSEAVGRTEAQFEKNGIADFWNLRICSWPTRTEHSR